MIVEIDVSCVGGLGNQLFELATAIALNPAKIIMPTNVDRQGKKMNYEDTIFSSAELKKLVQFETNPQPHGVLIQERQWHHDPSLFSALSPSSIGRYILRGYFQCYKYFHHIRHELQTKWFPAPVLPTPPPPPVLPEKRIGIHVRRGDYVTLAEIHGLLSVRYYERALKHFLPHSSYRFVVVSDDLKWCQKEDVFRTLPHVNFYKSSDVGCFTELRENCDGLIIGNSTFSWWAAYLSTRAQTVVAPSTWFGTQLQKNYRVSDLFPPEWLLESDSIHVSPRRALHKYIRPTLIETGTYLGEGVDDALRVGFPHVISIEIVPKFYEQACTKYKSDARVELYKGSTVTVLPSILQKITQPVTFFLDAMYSFGNTSYDPQHVCPLMEELKAIAAHPIKTHTILIDDCRLMQKSKNGGMDGLLNVTKQEVIEFIKTQINPNYHIQYENGHVPNDILVATVQSRKTEKEEKEGEFLDLRKVKTRILSPNAQKYALRYEATRTMLEEAGFEKVELEKTGLTPGTFAGGILGYISVLQKHLNEMKAKTIWEPLLTVEDDVMLEQLPNGCKISLPKETDMVYVGVSCCGLQSHIETDGRELVMAKVENYPDLVQVYNMLSTHALLWMSRDVTVEAIRRFRSQLVHAPEKPWDCRTARLQEYFNVFALKTPLFYQGCTPRDESLTRIRLDGPYISNERYELWTRNRCIGWFV